MKHRFLLLLGVIAGSAFMACSDEVNSDPNTTSPGIPVKTMAVQPRRFQEYIRITGVVKANSRIQVFAEEGGTLTEIRRDKGAYVAQGDTLAVLQNRVLTAQRDEAQAVLRQARLDLRSKETLYQQKAISENEYLTARYAADRAKAAADLMSARHDKLTIVSHAAGFVNARLFDPGAYLAPMSRLFEIVDKSRLKIAGGVAEKFLPDLRIGTPVEITFDAFPEVRISAKISFVSHSIEPVSRTFEIEVKIANEDGKLAPEMVANLKILRRALDDQVVIPADAFLESEEGRYVFISEGNRAKRIDIEILAVYNDEILVRGLAPGQELVILGQQELVDGSPLDVIR